MDPAQPSCRMHDRRAGTETVPVFTVDSLDEGGAQLCPCGIATATPQHFTVASKVNIHMPTPKFPVETSDGCAPHPAHIRQIGAGEPLRDVHTLVPRVLLFVTLAEPTHLAVLARPVFVRAAPTHPGTSSASPPCCDRDSGEGLSPHSTRQRLTAHVDQG